MAQVNFDTTAAASVRRLSESYRAAHGTYPKCFVLTFGCQQNVADSEKLSGMAVEMGYTLTDTPEEATLILVNTCAIIPACNKRTITQYRLCLPSAMCTSSLL